jgi:hypothetical protein
VGSGQNRGLGRYAQGLTAKPLTERYARWRTSLPRDALHSMESVPAAEHRLRVPSPAVRLDRTPDEADVSSATSMG